MLGCSERQRVRGLLAEAINMLCKTSLKYKFGFSIEGLLGITIDNSQVLLINIQEEFKNSTWPDCSAAGKAPSSPLSNSPMDLSTTSHPKAQPVSDSAKTPTATEQAWYCPTPNTQTPQDSRLSPEIADVKPNVDLSLLDQPNELRSTALSNGRGRTKGKRHHAQNSKDLKRGHSTLPLPKQHQPKPKTTAATSKSSTSSAADASLNLSDDDVIYIKDEEDSEDESTQRVFPDPVVSHPIHPPVSPVASKKRRTTSAVALPSSTQDNKVSPDSPVAVKVEEDSCSSGGPIEEDNRSSVWREDSPSEATYNAGMWQSQDAVSTTRHRAVKESHPSNTTNKSAAYNLPMHAGASNAKASLQEVSLADTAPTVSALVLCPTPDQVMTVSENPSDQLPSSPSDVATAPAEEAENSAQALVQMEGDQTEWPADLPRRPRASYSTAYKLMIVRKALESGNMRATARRFGIHFKQVWQWSRNKEKLLAMSLSALRSPRLLQQVEEERQARRERAEATSSASAASSSENFSTTT